ncbi:unnamed protein product [Closterium sp. NIES-65]|nr:unnamed protein product [Closterium sp. NIES-65]
MLSLGAEPEGAEPGGAESRGAEPRGAELEGTASRELEALPLEALELEALELEALELLVPEVLEVMLVLEALEVEVPEVLELLVMEVLVLEVLELPELVVLLALWGAGAVGAGGARGATGTGGTGGAPGARGARARGTRGDGAADLGGARTGGARAAKAGGTAGVGGAGATVTAWIPVACSCSFTEVTEFLTERREPETRASTPVRAGRVARPCPPPVPGTHTMALRPSSVPQRVPLPSPPASSLPAVPDPESDLVRAAIPTLTRLLATIVIGPSFESAAASALVAELVDFAAACRFDYATSLVAESESDCPPYVWGECVLGTDVLEHRQEDFECLAAAVPHLVAMLLAPKRDPDAPNIPTPRYYAEVITCPYSFHCQTAIDAEMASWKSTGTYNDEVPPPGTNIVDGMWIFRVKRPTGSPLVFKARYVARRDYQLHSLDFSTDFLQSSLHEEIWLRRPPGFTGSSPACTQWSLRQLVYGLRQAPRQWHDTLRTTLAALGFALSTADLSLFLRNDTSLPLSYILVYLDNLVFATADTEALALVKLELEKRHTCTYLLTHGAPGPSALPLPVLFATAYSFA